MSKYGNLLSRPLTTASVISLSCISSIANAAVVINEIDYDQPGTDNAEFIELFNSGSSAVSLDNYSLDLINGNNDASYRNIDLSGFSINANDFFVVCGDASQVANCDYSFTSSSSGWFQNGAPDALALYENTSLLDAISYEGSVGMFPDGSDMNLADSNSEILSIARIIDGVSTNNNARDFQLSCITPGSANRGGSGNCSVASVNPVPIPAAVWLFGSGIIGLLGVSRRR